MLLLELLDLLRAFLDLRLEPLALLVGLGEIAFVDHLEMFVLYLFLFELGVRLLFEGADVGLLRQHFADDAVARGDGRRLGCGLEGRQLLRCRLGRGGGEGIFDLLIGPLHRLGIGADHFLDGLTYDSAFALLFELVDLLEGGRDRRLER